MAILTQRLLLLATGAICFHSLSRLFPGPIRSQRSATTKRHGACLAISSCHASSGLAKCTTTSPGDGHHTSVRSHNSNTTHFPSSQVLRTSDRTLVRPSTSLNLADLSIFPLHLHRRRCPSSSVLPKAFQVHLTLPSDASQAIGRKHQFSRLSLATLDQLHNRPSCAPHPSDSTPSLAYPPATAN